MPPPKTPWTRERVKFLRTRIGLSQEAFARLLGISYTTVNSWERGSHKVSKKMAKRLDELVDYLHEEAGLG